MTFSVGKAGVHSVQKVLCELRFPLWFFETKGEKASE